VERRDEERGHRDAGRRCAPWSGGMRSGAIGIG
jgi:hypothetical protein